MTYDDLRAGDWEAIEAACRPGRPRCLLDVGGLWKLHTPFGAVTQIDGEWIHVR